MNRIILLLVTFVVFIRATPSSAEDKPIPMFADGDRVCFLGDSITHGGYYWEYIQNWYVTRHPEWNIEIFECGYAGYPARGGVRRLDDEVFPNKPNKIVVMFGMNDIGRDNYFKEGEGDLQKVLGYRANDLASYEKNMREIIEKIKAHHVQAIILSPSPYDQTAQGPDQVPVTADDLVVAANKALICAKHAGRARARLRDITESDEPQPSADTAPTVVIEAVTP